MQWATFQEAKDLIKQKFPSGCTHRQFKLWTRDDAFPSNLPKSPYHIYKDSPLWEGWENFVGLSTAQFLPYVEAKKLILKLFPTGTSQRKYFDWVKTISFPRGCLPASPDKFYKARGDWVSWGDYCGTDSIASRYLTYVSYEEAAKLIQERFPHGCSSRMYLKWTSKPDFPRSLLPKYMAGYYRKGRGWRGWARFSGSKAGQKEGYIYVMTNVRYRGFIKIGTAIDLDSRLSQANVHDPNKCFLYSHVEWFSDRFSAERLMHYTLKKVHVSGEWFRASVERAKEIVKTILSKVDIPDHST